MYPGFAQSPVRKIRLLPGVFHLWVEYSRWVSITLVLRLSCGNPSGLERGVQLATRLGGKGVIAPTDELTTDEDLGNGAHPGNALECGLNRRTTADDVQLVNVSRDAEALEQTLGLGAVRAVRLGEDDDRAEGEEKREVQVVMMRKMWVVCVCVCGET